MSAVHPLAAAVESMMSRLLSPTGWHPAANALAEPGWLFNDSVPGTICIEAGRFHCYPLARRRHPGADFATLAEAAAFMEAQA